MTDRYNAFVVILDNEVRDEQAVSTLTALKQIKGVVSVEPVTSDMGTQIAKRRAQNDIAKRIIDLLYE